MPAMTPDRQFESGLCSISVVVAVRDAADVLPRCLDSVIGQEYEDVDLVVIDGGSSDHTVDVIKSRANSMGFWVSEPDDGVYDAWNKALDHVVGEWVCFLGADDRLAQTSVLARLAPYLRDRRERVVYGITNVVDGDGRVAWAMGRPWPETRSALTREMSLPNPSLFYRRDLFEAHGRFDATYRIAGDYEFLLRELLTGEAYFVDEVITEMGAGGISQEPANRVASLREAARARRTHGIPTPPDWRSYQIYEAHIYALAHRRLGRVRAERLWAKYWRARERMLR